MVQRAATRVPKLSTASPSQRPSSERCTGCPALVRCNFRLDLSRKDYLRSAELFESVGMLPQAAGAYEAGEETAMIV